jgi:hypothetical protein
MKNLTTEITEFHGVVDTKIVFSPCYSVYSVVFYSGVKQKNAVRQQRTAWNYFLYYFFTLFFLIYFFKSWNKR